MLPVCRRFVSWACWPAAVWCGVAAGRALPNAEAAWLLAAAALLALAGVFLHPILSLRVALLPVTALLAAIGVGMGGEAATVVLAVAVGAAVTVEVLHGRVRAGADARRRLEQHGIVTSGTVVKAWRYYVGAIPMTRVAVHYVDGDGNEQHGRTSADGVVAEGSRVRLCYLPEHPATIAVLRS